MLIFQAPNLDCLPRAPLHPPAPAVSTPSHPTYSMTQDTIMSSDRVSDPNTLGSSFALRAGTSLPSQRYVNSAGAESGPGPWASNLTFPSLFLICKWVPVPMGGCCCGSHPPALPDPSSQLPGCRFPFPTTSKASTGPAFGRSGDVGTGERRQRRGAGGARVGSAGLTSPRREKGCVLIRQEQSWSEARVGLRATVLRAHSGSKRNQRRERG